MEEQTRFGSHAINNDDMEEEGLYNLERDSYVQEENVMEFDQEARFRKMNENHRQTEERKIDDNRLSSRNLQRHTEEGHDQFRKHEERFSRIDMESKLYLKEKEVEELRMEIDNLIRDNERLQREVLEH